MTGNLTRYAHYCRLNDSSGCRLALGSNYFVLEYFIGIYYTLLCQALCQEALVSMVFLLGKCLIIGVTIAIVRQVYVNKNSERVLC